MTRRRGTPAVLTLLAVLATACGTDDVTAPDPASGEFVACGPVEVQQIQGGTHLIGDAEAPVPWNSRPGTSGWHAGGEVPFGILDEPVGDAVIVSALEAGKVVLAHDGTLDLAGLDHVVEEADDRLVVAQYDQQMPSPAALLAWGRLTRCTELQFADITAFVVAEAGRVQDHQDAR